MALELPNLINKNFSETMEEMVNTIPRYTSDWTNMNPSDPGIATLEVLAWFSENLLYRMDRITGKSQLNYLRMVAGVAGPDELVPNGEFSQLDQVLGGGISFEECLKKLRLKEGKKGVDDDQFRLDDLSDIREEGERGIRFSTDPHYEKLLLFLLEEEAKFYLIDRYQKQRNDPDFDRDELAKKREIMKTIKPKHPAYYKEAAQEFMKSPYRAITKKDFEELAKDATRNQDDKVRKLIIREEKARRRLILTPVATGEDGRIIRERSYLQGMEEDERKSIDEEKERMGQLLASLGNFYAERKLIGTSIRIDAPIFSTLEIEITLTGNSLFKPSEIIKNVDKSVREYLDPLTGGEDGQGWSYDDVLTFFQLAYIIEETEGVEALSGDIKINELKIENEVITKRALENFEDNRRMWVLRGLPFVFENKGIIINLKGINDES